MRRVAVVVLLVVIGVALKSCVFDLDVRLVRPSRSGGKALAYYLIGRYAPAARAYRADLADRVANDPDADPEWKALLTGDLSSAKRIADERAHAGDASNHSLLTLGEIALARNETTAALGYFDRVRKQEPDQFDALLLTSVVHARAGADEAAIDALNRALRSGGLETRITSLLWALETVGDLEARPMARRPLCLLAHYHRYLRVYDPTQARVAIRYARRAIRAGDHPDAAYLAMAVVQAKEGKSRSALASFEAALRLNPRDTTALLWAAALHADRGDLASEYRLTRTAFELAPDDPYVANTYHRLLTDKLGDYHQALDLSLRATSRNPNDRDAWWRVAAAQLLVGDYEESISSYRNAIALSPGRADLYDNLGYALRELGRIDEAIAAYRKSAAMASRSYVPHFELADIYRMQRRYTEAIDEYEIALSLGGREPRRILGLCALYYDRGALDHARPCLEYVLMVEPTNLQALGMLEHVAHDLSLQRTKS
jgi:tetratricopeptide (TPR) repeat protein